MSNNTTVWTLSPHLTMPVAPTAVVEAVHHTIRGQELDRLPSVPCKGADQPHMLILSTDLKAASMLALPTGLLEWLTISSGGTILPLATRRSSSLATA